MCLASVPEKKIKRRFKKCFKILCIRFDNGTYFQGIVHFSVIFSICVATIIWLKHSISLIIDLIVVFRLFYVLVDYLDFNQVNSNSFE